MSKRTLHLDLHPIATHRRTLESALEELFHTAAKQRAARAEIIPGKGTGQLMRRVKKWLAQPAIKAQYKRVVVDQHNHGRLFVIFR